MRVLAVTRDANLVTALTSMLPGWEISTVREASAGKDAAGESAVALVDLGTTEKGLVAAEELRQSGVTIPCLVIGDVEVPGGARTHVLVRPFTLNDLSEAVTRTATAVWEPEEVVEEPAAVAEAPEVDGSEPAAEEPLVAAEPELDVRESPEQDRADLEEPRGEIVSEILEEMAQGGMTPAPAPVEDDGDEELVVEEVPELEPKPAPPVALREPEPPPPAEHTPPAEHAASVGAGATAAVTAPAPARPLPPAGPPVETSWPRGPRPAKPAGGGLLRRLGRARKGDERRPDLDDLPAESGMIARLKTALTNGRELEKLVGELPVLAQPRAMAHAFLGEVVDLFAPQVAAVYASRTDGSYSVIAGHGLSNVEAGMTVPPNQALFMEISSGLEAVLIAPVDLAQGLVAGIGGARTEALMAAPLEVSGKCHAIAIVGRDELSEFDLELLSEMAEEAAPGLAVAQLIERLRCL